MYEFPGEGRKAEVHVPPWNPLEERPWLGHYIDIYKDKNCVEEHGHYPKKINPNTHLFSFE